ncbi:DUF7694 domain-containing protein [Pseudomonas abieticivorans]|uniref:DUF7694 domain-containing protein n=1 Tax=Pseudomonas abieticivorans TaxID=2931382 RepID=UPI0020BEE078|nr:hypothetical protein [Pseudomonas sp. PIA16]
MTSRIQRRLLEKENARQPSALVKVHRHEWPGFQPPTIIEVWRARSFLVQIHTETEGYERMSVSRTTYNGDSWVDQLTWDELMQLKRECGRGDRDAFEVYPADRDIVNVANMRHLFFPPGRQTFKWCRP